MTQQQPPRRYATGGFTGRGDPAMTPRRDTEHLPTICTAGGGFLADPLIVPLSNSSSAGVPRSTSEPIRTVTTAKGGDQAMAVPLVAPLQLGSIA